MLNDCMIFFLYALFKPSTLRVFVKVLGHIS